MASYETCMELLEAIKEHSGLDEGEIIEAAEYGVDVGWTGFIYSEDCEKFYNKNADLIYECLNEDAKYFGYSCVDEYVATFCRKDMLDTDQGRKNLLAWYALETVGSFLIDKSEGG